MVLFVILLAQDAQQAVVLRIVRIPRHHAIAHRQQHALPLRVVGDVMYVGYTIEGDGLQGTCPVVGGHHFLAILIHILWQDALAHPVEAIVQQPGHVLLRIQRHGQPVPVHDILLGAC